MPRATKPPKPNEATKRSNRSGTAATASNPSPTEDLVFVNVALSGRVRAGLNKLVELDSANQRNVLEQLITDELRRRNMRLPRA